MPSIDVEAEALEILRSNQVDPDRPPWMKLLACCVLRRAANVREVPGLKPKARWCEDQDVIEIRPGQSPRSQAYFIGHELGERHLALRGYSEEDREEVATSLGVALLLPRPALRRVVREHGRNLIILSRELDISQSIVLLRIGEVFGVALALVTPRRIRVRGEEGTIWPSEQEIRRYASGRAAGPFDREVITDAPNRVGLMMQA